MPLDPMERLSLFGQYKKTMPANERLQDAGRKMSKIGRLPDSEILDLLETFKEKSDILEKIVAELMETGTIQDTGGGGRKALLEMLLKDATTQGN